MILLSQVPTPFDVTYDANNLFVALVMYTWNGTAWVAESAPIPALLITGTFTYAALYTPLKSLKPYIAEIRSYTDGTYATPDLTRAAKSTSVLWDPSVAKNSQSTGIMIVGGE